MPDVVSVRVLLNRAVAIDAINLDGVARFSVEFAVAVAVLLEVAVDAVHSFFQMDVFEVHRLPELVGIVKRDLLVVLVEQVAFAIVLEDGAENPAMAVEVGELGVLQLPVELGRAGFLQEVRVGPQAAHGGAFGIARLNLVLLGCAGIALLGGPHVLAIHFVVPPGIAEISRDHVRPRVHVADHALAGRNRARELVADGMSGLISRNGGIGGRGLSQISGRSVGAGMFRRTIVGVDHVAGAAAAGPVVAGLIVGAGERQQRIEQAGLLQSEKNRIGAQFGAEAALAQFDLRLARLFFEAWIPYFRLFPAASFEHAQDVAGLRNLPALQRIEIRQHSFLADLFRRGRREGEQSLRFAVGAVAFAEAWGLQRECAVVVERRAPQHGAVGHHAGLDFSYFRGVAAAGAAGFIGDPQVSRVDEANVIPVFVEPLGVGSRRIGGAAGIVRVPWLRMGLAFRLMHIAQNLSGRPRSGGFRDCRRGSRCIPGARCRCCAWWRCRWRCGR